MSVTLLLPWFPIILAVGVGGRLLGRSRGLGMGVLCALFWVVLVQATGGANVWRDPWVVATMVAGAVAITTMGCWAGENPVELRRPRDATIRVSPRGLGAGGGEFVAPLARLSAAMEQFDAWREQNRVRSDPWPAFDEFLRSLLYQSVGASHVRTYHLTGDGRELVPLHRPDAQADDDRPSARRGIVGHVVTTGRAFVEGDDGQCELLDRLADEGKERVAWCFAIRDGAQRVGAVTVGHLGVEPDSHRALLRAVEQLTSQFWCAVAEMVRGRSAGRVDPVSGLHARSALLLSAEEALRESYALSEPVAVAVIALEGLREINDAGRWESADELVAEVSRLLKAKLRSDDRLGRFDDSRFVLLLRRVDSELATLIVTQILNRVQAVCEDHERWRASVHVRCGLAGSGLAQPDLRALLARALREWRRATDDRVPLATDLDATPGVVGAKA